jgi:predicted Holliday junction resolvase-like endonuclease
LTLLAGILGALALVLGVFLIRARQNRRLDQSSLQAREQTEARLLEENKYYKELFELGDVSYKESQERIQSLMGAVNTKDVVLMKGAAALEAANTNMKKLMLAVQEKDQDLHVLEQSLNFQEGQYKKLLSQKKSSEVRTGKIAEQISPFLNDYPLNPRTARFIGDPIDFVHFDEDKVTFVEVKSGKSQLSTKQRRIRDMIKDGKVEFIIYRVKGED